MNTPSRLFVWCAPCRSKSAIVVGRDGHEVRDCLSCGRRRSVRDEVNRKLLGDVAKVSARRSAA